MSDQPRIHSCWGPHPTKPNASVNCVEYVPKVDYDRLLAEAEALRADAERYRWMRSAETGKAVNCVAPGAFPAWLNGPELDAAIDAAREGGKP